RVQVEAGDGILHHFREEIVQTDRVVERLQRLARRTELVRYRPAGIARRGEAFGQRLRFGRRRLSQFWRLRENRHGDKSDRDCHQAPRRQRENARAMFAHGDSTHGKFGSARPVRAPAGQRKTGGPDERFNESTYFRQAEPVRFRMDRSSHESQNSSCTAPPCSRPYRLPPTAAREDRRRRGGPNDHHARESAAYLRRGYTARNAQGRRTLSTGRVFQLAESARDGASRPNPGTAS